MNRADRQVWVNGSFYSAGEPALPAEIRGAMYGVGCFETFLVRDRRVLDLDKHLERFRKGSTYLGVQPPVPLDESLPGDLINSLIKKNSLPSEEAVVRMQLLSSGSRGYGPDAEEGYLILSASRWNPMQAGGITLHLTDTRTVPAICRPPDLKLSNSLHYLMAYRESAANGADDGILLSVEGYVAETSKANLFWRQGETVYTPSPDCDILPGTMRNRIIDLLTSEGIELVEGRFSPGKMLEADLLWVTNSLYGISPVGRMSEREWPVEDHLYRFIREQLEEEWNNLEISE
ncbi:MAG: aminotransferase class IV [Balneolaceae bacterium]